MPANPSLRAVLALIAHEGRACDGDPLDYALTSHEIEHTPSGVNLGPGRLLSTQDQQALLSILMDTVSAESVFLPSDVLSHSSAQVAWYVPGRVRRMWFRSGTHTKRVNVPWPTLAFCARRDALRLVALGRTRRPCAHDPVFHAPLMNVFDHTGLCTGSARLPRGTGLEDRPGYEAAVYDTAFSHINHSHTLRRPAGEEVTDAEHLQFWTQLAARHARRFPSSALVPLRDTLAHWLTRD
jgi:PRTRC genetic system protein B